MSLKALSDYTFYSRYSRYNTELKRRETWNESVERVFDMHREKYKDAIEKYPELLDEINFAESQQKKKRVLAAQRSLQFAGNPIFKHELKMFNCTATHIDRPRAFQEIMYVLLCGCGVGFSVQKQHIEKLPKIYTRDLGVKKYIIEDSIEGWADAIGVLFSSYFRSGDERFKEYFGYNVTFNYSLIRPEGSLIAGQFKAPGPKGLNSSIILIETLLDSLLIDKEVNIKPINAYDCIMHISNAVLSGGVRRSATICLFSHDDDEMINAKVGDWFEKNPQRARSNNSAALLKGSVSKEEFSKLMKSTKEFGEPGFIWLDNLDIIFNPCTEIGLYPKLNAASISGFQGCNLTEINGKFCNSLENFLQACRASAIIGTLQAGYNNFKYLTPDSAEIFKKESLLGCSITGMMDNPEILFNEEYQRMGAEEIKKINSYISSLIGINPAARTTCVKPAGSTSCVLGTASGIHPHHARRYLRRVQANKTEFCLSVFEKENPIAVENSAWSSNKTDKVISFLCEVPAGAITKNQVSAIDLLEKVKLTQQNWVEYGTNEDLCVIPKIRHNVSNTIVVKSNEWDDVESFIFNNQEWFAGISLLSASGDLDYVQAPFATILSPNELIREYGDASIFASGLIVDGLKAFDDNLWKACDTVLGFGEDIQESIECPVYPNKRNNKELAMYFLDKMDYDIWFNKIDWIRRVKQFSERYFAGDLRKTTYCLKHCSLWKTWCDLKREYKDIDWTVYTEDNQEYVNADTLGSQACAGGSCEIL
jgi:ribonucleoside-diphosphate reductase alpha chain